MKQELVFIKEMKQDVVSVPIARGVDITKMTLGDNEPMFVTLEALNDEKASANGRFYSAKEIENIAQQINDKKPVAYLGHIKEEDRQNVAPKPQTIWVGAKTFRDEKGVTRLFIKGYVLPYAKDLRYYLNAAKGAGKQVAVSIYGQAVQTYNRIKKYYDISHTLLESIDWTRDMSNGVETAGYLAITAEMVEDKKGYTEVLKKFENLRTVISEGTRNKELIDKMDEGMKTVMEMVGADSIETLYSTISEMAEENVRLNKLEADLYIDDSLNAYRLSSKAKNEVKESIVAEMEKGLYNKATAMAVISEMFSSDKFTDIVKKSSDNFQINPLEITHTKSIENKYVEVKDKDKNVEIT